LSRESGGVTFGPRFFGDNPASSPRSRAARQVVNSDEYSPSRRSRAPISPGFVHRSASRTIRRLYSAVNRRRSALATTSTSGRLAAASPASSLISSLAVFSTTFIHLSLPALYSKL
jgi:hypothetical protein